MSEPILITPPAADAPVISLAEAKAHLRVRHADDDTYIAQAIADAVDYVETLESRVLINQTWQQSVAAFDVCGVRLGLSPVSSIAEVKYYDGENADQTLPVGNYVLSHDDQSPIVTWIGDDLPALYPRPDAVRINYVAGYGADASAVPAATKRAVLKFMAQFYGVRGTSDVPVASLANDAYELVRSKRRMVV